MKFSCILITLLSANAMKPIKFEPIDLLKNPSEFFEEYSEEFSEEFETSAPPATSTKRSVPKPVPVVPKPKEKSKSGCSLQK